FVTEILAPVPRADIARQWIRKRIYAKRRMGLVQTTKQNRADIALLQTAAAHQFNRGLAKIVELPFMIHAIDLCRVKKSLHVLAQAEDRRAALGRITPDAFKDT